MPDHVFYFRGEFPPGFAGSDVTADLIRDVKTLLELGDERVKRISADLQAAPGFLDRQSVEAILRPIVENDEISRRLARLLRALHGRLRPLGQDVGRMVSLIEEWVRVQGGQPEELLSGEELSRLRDVLSLVVKLYPALERQEKAVRLSQTTGLPLEDVKIICDLRPVFDDDRKVVEGVFPYTILKVVCQGVDGLPVCLEAILSRKQVADLAELTSAAKRKLEVLTKLLAEKGVRVPSINLTREEEAS